MKDNSYLKNLIENMDENTSLKQLQNYVDEMVNIRGFADETPQPHARSASRSNFQ